MMTVRTILAAALAGVLLSAATARAQDVAEFYRGKRINMVIGYSAAGGYDLYARLLARFMGEHIPGKPTIVPQNMPGASSRLAANWVYNVAPKDGTVIATISQSTPLDQALGQAGIQFDARRFNWIGNMIVVNNVMYVTGDTGVATIEDVKSKPVAVGATGASSPSVIYPQVSNNLFGTKFRIVSGYGGGGDIRLAIDRGELNGRGSDSWASVKATTLDWVKTGKIRILFQVGLTREPDLPDVPLWSELAKDPKQKQTIEILSNDVILGRPFVVAPEVPADRVAALRRAFDLAMKDPQLVEQANKAKMDLNPLDGATLQREVERTLSAPPDVIETVKAALKITDVQQLSGAKGEAKE